MIKPHQWTVEQAQTAQTPNLGKKYVTEPALFALLGDVGGKKILELGSGNGYWLEMLSEQGAQCTGVEQELEQLTLARQKSHASHIEYVQADITQLGGYGLVPGTYDVAFTEHVLLEIPSKEGLTNIFRNAYSLLKPGGRLIVSDLHPFAPSLKPGNMRVPDTLNYFSSGEVFETVAQLTDGKEITYRDYHWTLEDLASAITAPGFLIKNVHEPRPSQEAVAQHPHLAYRLTVPMALMVEAVKV